MPRRILKWFSHVLLVRVLVQPSMSLENIDRIAGATTMNTYADQRAMLDRMVKAKEETRNHRIIIERQIDKRAERLTFKLCKAYIST